MSEENLSRRAALEVVARCSAAVVVAGLTPLAGCAGAGHGAGDPPLIVDLATVPAGSGVTTSFRGKPVLVLNAGGAIRAFSGLCTHEGCELGWNPRQQLIRCPCHGSAFDPNGQVTRGPAKDPLPEYRALVRDGKIVVRVS